MRLTVDRTHSNSNRPAGWQRQCAPNHTWQVRENGITCAWRRSLFRYRARTRPGTCSSVVRALQIRRAPPGLPESFPVPPGVALEFSRRSVRATLLYCADDVFMELLFK